MIVLGFIFLLWPVFALAAIRTSRVVSDWRMRQVTEPLRLAIHCKAFKA